MPYHPTGVDRDSYISGIRQGNGRPIFHDVSARRDNLPDNVYRYIKEQVERERYEEYSNAEKRGRNQIEHCKGRRVHTNNNNTMDNINNEEYILNGIYEADNRHVKLKMLYEREMQEWERELAAKGLAIDK
eukprot:Tbor_TRINITY_DN5369_c3_g2::TRINITY_DN5369_c3_g2_i15::g.3957::m.3957